MSDIATINNAMRLHELFDDHREILIQEAGVGLVVPGVNTTPDVGPNEITKQGKKFKFRISPRGQVPKMRSDGKIAGIK